jgi:diguanylate cyclase (GGDEF)-like protein/PAS domain S-box-containing protein
MRRCLECLLALLPCAAIAAPVTPPGFVFESVSARAPLAQNTVSAIAQDAEGFVWVATQGGLHRYDGERFTVYRHDPRDPESLPDSTVTALATDPDGVLWIGSYSQYVARLDLHSGKLTHYPAAHGDRPGDPARRVLALLPDRSWLWVGTAAGLERLDLRDGARRTVLQLQHPTPLPRTQALIHDRAGNVWYATGDGLFRVTADLAATRIGPATPAHSLLAEGADQVLVGNDDGLFRADAKGLVPVWPAPGAAGPRAIVALTRDRLANLWFAVAGDGLRRLDASGNVLAVREDPARPLGLPNNAVTALLADRSGWLWVGSWSSGIARADIRGTRFSLIRPVTRGAPDHVNTSIRAITQARDGSLWLGSDGNQLLRVDLDDGRVDNMSALLLDDQANPAQPPRPMRFTDAGDGRRWLATSDGLFLLDPLARSARRIGVAPLAHADLRTLAVGRDGMLWIGSTSDGLYRFDPTLGGVRHYPYRNGDPGGLSHAAVHAVLVDLRGRVWIGTSDGLDLLDPTSNRLRHFRQDPGQVDSISGNLVRTLLQARDGTIWIGTHAGLNQVSESAEGRIRFLHPLHDALGDGEPMVYSLRQASDGTLWLGTDRGLVRFNPATGRSRRFGRLDGLQDAEFNGSASAVLDDGRLAFGGLQGVNVFDPHAVLRTTAAPDLRLLAVHVGSDRHALSPAPWQPDDIQLAESDDVLRLRVGVINAADPATTHYRYRLEGSDDRWVDNDRHSEIVFTGLAAGEYRLHLQAAGPVGDWMPQELLLGMNVSPPAWRSWPALLAYTVLALAALVALLLYRHRQWRREQAHVHALREREERLQLALWASGEYFWDYDLASRRLTSTRVRDDADGEHPGGAVETELEHPIHPEDLPLVRRRLREHLRGDAPMFVSEHRVLLDPVGWIWVRARGRIVERDANGHPLRISGIARDITASRHAERERQVAAEVLRSMSEAVSVLDEGFHFVSVNQAFTRMTEYGAAEVIGRSSSLLDSNQHEPDFYHAMREHLAHQGHWSGEMWQRRKSGEEFLCAIESSRVQGGDDDIVLYVAVLSDITEQKRAEQELRYLANFDTLTSLPNRTLLSERLSRAIVRARRQGSRVAVLFLDLDRFKDVNDSLGHAAGDRILRAAANRLQQTVGPNHTVARLGGDEFTVVLEDIADPAEADRVAREILMAFEAPLGIDERQDVVISPSIGISLYPDHAQVPTDLLKQADTAMYQAKSLGRRTFQRYTEATDARIRERAILAGALRKVLDRNELRVVYQPRMSLGESRIVSVEALLRWHSEEFGEVGPARFIPLAEESGIILEIGEWVLREACNTLQRWRQHGLEQVAMSVNVSALQLLRGDLPAVLARILEQTGVPPQMLELELTESVVMSNPEQTASVLAAFRALGVSIAVDDFGTGYSSLAYLKRLPITTLKIDKTFIGDITHDPDDEAITSTVIMMAHSLGLNVVAEGVETAEQVEYLRAHRCDEIQGFWLARPMDPQRCLGFLRTWQPDLRPSAAP